MGAAEISSPSATSPASAAAVAGWYVLRGSGEQARSRHPAKRLPSVLLSGADHVEVELSRSAAAFGLSEAWLEDIGASWFQGEHGRRREARAAALAEIARPAARTRDAARVLSFTIRRPRAAATAA